jgi:uncharacterized protein (DUF1778 family)
VAKKAAKKKAAKTGATKAPKAAKPKAPTPDRPVSLRLTAPEFQLVSYAASKARARGVNAFMREAVVEAARHAAGKEMSEDILSGRGTVRLLKESLADARAVRR